MTERPLTTMDADLQGLFDELADNLKQPRVDITKKQPRVARCADCAKIPEGDRPLGRDIESPPMVIRVDGLPVRTALCEMHATIDRERRRLKKETERASAEKDEERPSRAKWQKTRRSPYGGGNE